MRDFLKYLLATIVGFFIIGLIGIVCVLAIIAGAVASNHETPSLENNSVLEIKLQGILEDRSSDNPLAIIMGQEIETQGLNNILGAIEAAKKNDKVKAIFLNTGIIQADLANLQELRNALLSYKKTGKKIFAYGENYSQGAYYVASVADKIMINPTGMIDWHGMSVQTVYYKELLDKLGIGMQLIRVGKYKSYGETVTRTDMSDENRMQIKELITPLWQTIRQGVAETRHISAAQLDTLANQYITLLDAQHYKEYKLVDEIVYQDQAKKILHESIGGDDLKMVTPKTLLTAQESKEEDKEDHIAVYYATGNIVNVAEQGIANDNVISAEEMVPEIEKLTEEENVKAVVIRINSPGGSASASEMIWHAVRNLEKKKPVIISMGGTAASGGYYIASAAKTIFADPTTVTGSIGIFAMIPNAENLLTNKLGIKFETVKTNAAGDFLSSVARPLTQAESGAMQAYVNRGYDLFIQRVAAGRNMTAAQVDTIAQGRVWAGTDAKRIGLVDHLGGLKEAIAFAAQKVDIKPSHVVNYPTPAPWYHNLIDQATDNYFESQLRSFAGELYEPLRYTQRLRGQDCIQMAMPYHMLIK